MKKSTKTVICSIPIIIGIVFAKYSDDMRTSKAGLELIGNAESCRNEPYLCPANILTVGVGSTGNVEKRKYSDDEIAKRWADDIKSAEQCINRYANGKNLPQPIFDATVSLTFNVGCPKIKGSLLYSHLRNERYKLACDEFLRWNKSGGKVLTGLVIRREKEKLLCLSYVLSSQQ